MKSKKSKNPEKKCLLKAHRMHLKLFLMFSIAIFIIAFSSFNVSASSKIYNHNTQTVTIRNFWHRNVADIHLVDNTAQCLTNCHATLKITPYRSIRINKNNNLMFKFKDRNNNFLPPPNLLKNYTYFILQNETYSVNVNDYGNCTGTRINNQTGENETYTYKCVVGSHKEPRVKKVWKPFPDKITLKKNHDYYIKLEGRKQLGSEVDWIISLLGEDVEEWAWWNTDWKYREPINISNTAGNLTDYQVKLSINTTKLYDEGKLNVSCNDLRFTNSSDVEINYWIENCTTNDNSTNSTVWVKVPFLENATNTTIYMYYGNPAANSTSNGTATFDFFDDFEDGTYNGWTEYGGTIVGVESGVLHTQTTNAPQAILYTGKTFGRNVSIEAKLNVTSYYVGLGFLAQNGSNYYISRGMGEYRLGLIQGGNAVVWASGADRVADVWHVYKVWFNPSDTIYADISGDTVSLQNSTFSTGYAGIASWSSTTEDEFLDWIFVRKYANPEPTATIGAEEVNGIGVTLISPSDNTITNNTLQTFTCNESSPLANLTNSTLYVWNSTGVYYQNTINISGTSNQTSWTINITPNDYKWNCLAYDTDGNSTFAASNFTLTITKELNVTLLEPEDNYQTTDTTINFTANVDVLNYNLTNATLYVWKPDGSLFGTNTTTLSGNSSLNVSRTISGLVLAEGYKWNFKFCGEKVYDGDECNWSASNRTFSVVASVDNESYDAYVYETQSSTFQINVTLPAGATLYNAKFNYNGTNYTGVNVYNNGSFYSLTRTIDIPALPNGTANENRSFNWYFVYSGNVGQSVQSSPAYQQNVSQIVLAQCNTTYTTQTANFTVRDEEGDHKLITSTTGGNSWSADFQYWLGSGTTYKTYSKSVASTNDSSIAFCIDHNETYHTDMDLKYSSEGYTQRTYYFDNTSLTNDTKYITLYLLNASSGTNIILNVIDQDSSAVPDVIVYVYKKDVGRLFSTKTDTQGHSVIDLNINSKYRFVLFYKGEQVYDSGYMWITSTTVTLQINLANYNVISTINAFRNMKHSLTYNNGTFTLTWDDTNNISDQVCLKVTKEDFNTSTTVGTDCSTESSGVLTIDIGSSSGLYEATAYGTKDGVDYTIDTLEQDNRSFGDVFGTDMGLIMAFLVVGTVAFLGLFNPVAAIIFGIVTLIMTVVLGLVNVSYGALVGLIVVAIIIIIKLKV